MSDQDNERNPIDVLADEFLERHRRGEHPPLSEYTERFPDLAVEIRELFPVLLEIEQARAADASGGASQQRSSFGDATVVTSPVYPPGTLIAGRYKLLEQIAEGGMGTVWVAEQTKPVRRKVALKLIKPGMDSRQVLSRFEAERQALALMDHPNIAKVFDGGVTDEGRPFFVMEYVKGVPITQYCDDVQVAVRERLKLFVQVCQAVQHAHQKGIIHRDLKPSNILVCLYDGQPVPKVIDFGLAKAMHQPLTEHTLYTAHASVVGTPLYMSPEQAETNNLDIDTRSDVYSLGVVLYELLTGTTPLDRGQLKTAAWHEIVRLIKESEPARPSTKLSSSASLPSVAAQRGLEPAQLSRLVRGDLDWIVMKCLEKDRNRRYETANGLARDIERYLQDEPVQASPPSAAYRLKKFIRRNKTAAAFMLLLVAAVAALTVTNIQTSRAERRATIENAKAKAVSTLLQGMLGSANPDEMKDAQYTVRQLLDDFSAGFGELADQPEVEAEIRSTIGRAYWRLGVLDQAEPHLTRALELRRRQFGPAHTKIAESLVDCAWCLIHQVRLLEAEAAAREALRIYQARGTTGLPVIQAKVVLQRGLINSGQLNEAQAVAEEVLTLAGSSDVEYPEVAVVLHSLADTYIWLDRSAEAVQPARQAIEMHRRLYGAAHPETAWALLVLGRALTSQQKYPEAETALREALAIFCARYSGEHFSISWTSSILRQVLEARGDQTGLERLNSEMIARLVEAGIRQGNVLQLKVSLASLHRDSGNLDRAIEEATAALAQDPDYVDARTLRGDCYRALGELEKAEEDYSRVIELEPHLWSRWHARAQLYAQQGHWDKAQTDLATAVKLLASATPDEQNNMAWLLATAGEPRLRNPQSAVELAEKAVTAAPTAGNIWNTLGVAQYRAGQWQAAIESLEKAVALREGGDAFNWYFLAMAHWQLGNKDEARKWYDKAVEWMDKNAATNPELVRFRVEASELVTPSTDPATDQRAVLIAQAVHAGRHYAARGQWKDAAVAYLRYSQLDLNSTGEDEAVTLAWLDGVAVLVRIEDVAGYRVYYRRMLERFAGTTNPITAERVAKACLSYEFDAADLPEATRLADLAVTADKSHWVMPFAELAKALAEYHGGRYEEAERWCRQSLASDQDTWFRIAQCHLVIAMCKARLAKRDEALKELAQAERLIPGNEEPDNHNWIMTDLMRRQARALLETVELPPDERAVLNLDLRILDAVNREIEMLDEQLKTLAYRDDRMRLLVTLPGIDYAVAVVLIGALGDISRFRDGDHVAGCLGLVPSTRQSGDHCYHGPITKCGRSQARWMLIRFRRLSTWPARMAHWERSFGGSRGARDTRSRPWRQRAKWRLSPFRCSRIMSPIATQFHGRFCHKMAGYSNRPMNDNRLAVDSTDSLSGDSGRPGRILNYDLV